MELRINAEDGGVACGTNADVGAMATGLLGYSCVCLLLILYIVFTADCGAPGEHVRRPRDQSGATRQPDGETLPGGGRQTAPGLPVHRGRGKSHPDYPYIEAEVRGEGWDS